MIRHFASLMQTLENLRMLTLHTLADSLATSDKLWNGFKDSLLLTLYHKASTILMGGTDFIRAEEKQRELLAEEVRDMMPRTFQRDELDAHFAALPHLLKGSRAVATIPAHAAQSIATLSGLALLPCPLALPRYPIELGWRTSTQFDPVLLKVREAIVASFA